MSTYDFLLPPFSASWSDTLLISATRTIASSLCFLRFIFQPSRFCKVMVSIVTISTASSASLPAALLLGSNGRGHEACWTGFADIRDVQKAWGAGLCAGCGGLLVGKLAHRPRNFLLLVLRLSLSHLTLLSLHFKLTSPSYCNQLTFSLSFTLMKCTCVVSKIFASSVK